MLSSRLLRISRRPACLLTAFLLPAPALFAQTHSEWPAHSGPDPAVHAEVGPEEPQDSTAAGAFYLAPFAGMAVSAAPGYTAQVFGFHLQQDLGPRFSVDGWAGGSRDGGALNGALGLDLLLPLLGKRHGTSLSAVAGAGRWHQRQVGTTGFRAIGVMSGEELEEQRGGTFPPLQFWIDLRGGISSRRGPGRTGTRPLILASASIVIFARPRI